MAREEILIIEDDEDIQELLEIKLAREGYIVSGALNGEDGLKSIKSRLPNLILLDLMLPSIDGLEICKILKSEPNTRDIPIMMITAKGEEADIVTGLELGADDYITKPFSPRVLLARIKAVLRRKKKGTIPTDSGIQIHGITIDPSRHEVIVENKIIELTLTEFRILQLLAGKPGRVFTRYQIVDSVKGEDYYVTERSTDVHITMLRKKLGSNGKFIETVRGIGYRMKD